MVSLVQKYFQDFQDSNGYLSKICIKKKKPKIGMRRYLVYYKGIESLKKKIFLEKNKKYYYGFFPKKKKSSAFFFFFFNPFLAKKDLTPRNLILTLLNFDRLANFQNLKRKITINFSLLRFRNFCFCGSNFLNQRFFSIKLKLREIDKNRPIRLKKKNFIEKKLPTHEKLFHKKSLEKQYNQIFLNNGIYSKFLFFLNKIFLLSENLNFSFSKKFLDFWYFFFWKSNTFWYLTKKKKLNLKKLPKKKKDKLPLNMPPLISLDNNIVPLWLKKIKGLHKEYKCEICNGKYFRGFNSFYQHFNSSFHLRSLQKFQVPKEEQKFLKGINKKEDILKFLKSMGS